jgi:hypothetical protein
MELDVQVHALAAVTNPNSIESRLHPSSRLNAGRKRKIILLLGIELRSLDRQVTVPTDLSM